MPMRINRPVSTLVAAVAVMLAGAWALPGCGDGDRVEPDHGRQPLRYGLTRQSMSALAMLACDVNFFSRERLDIHVTEFVSGKRALQALLAGEVDAVTTAEVPIVFASLDRTDFRIVAGLATLSTNIERIVARADRGIRTPADLRGRTIATQRGSAVHFFLHMFLVANGMTEADVNLVYLRAEELPGALVGGAVDAFSMREPFVGQAVQALGSKAIVFEQPGVYYRTDYLVVSQELVESRPEVVECMVRALVRAEDMARADRAELVRVVAARLGVTNETIVRQELADMELNVSLGQALLTSLEDEAQWAIDHGLTDAVEAPNYLEFIYTDALESVKPDAVTIIR